MDIIISVTVPLVSAYFFRLVFYIAIRRSMFFFTCIQYADDVTIIINTLPPEAVLYFRVMLILKYILLMYLCVTCAFKESHIANRARVANFLKLSLLPNTIKKLK